jgi:hypothetical protein
LIGCFLLFIRIDAQQKQDEKDRTREKRKKKKKTITIKSSFDSIGERTDVRLEKKNADRKREREEKRML